MGDRLNTYGIGDKVLDNYMECINSRAVGLLNVIFNISWLPMSYYASLRYISATSVPSTMKPLIIRAGSIIEVGGDIYKLDTDEQIGAQSSEGRWYAKAVPASGHITIQLTQAAPVWDAERRGWYGTGAASEHRYILKFTYSIDYSIYVSYTSIRILDGEVLYAL